MPRAVPRPTCRGCGYGPPMKDKRLCVACRGVLLRYELTLIGVALVLAGASVWYLFQRDFWMAGLSCFGLLVWALLGYALPAGEWMVREVEE